MIIPDITKIGTIFSDKSRALILIELLGGARTTSELSKAANIKPQTAIYHLNKMLSLNILEKTRLGKNSYYKLKNEEIAKILEKLISLSTEPKISSLKESIRSKEIRFARLCYNHIAGHLGVSIYKSFLSLNYITLIGNICSLTSDGLKFLTSLNPTLKSKSYIGELCRDWSEKDYHISGELGHLIYTTFLNSNLIKKLPSNREITLTPLGESFFKEFLFIS